ncbi:threonine/serine exporter family protein [Fictibacillus sp. S7]|uniref:threonine/serine exporter family protein n=1 Tax=Fictibacillus sp. S7 TaxID=2212476 RepID=UPI001F5228FA|nr:threonine/serine exporter family protein [Fictibacillus sp. S7]
MTQNKIEDVMEVCLLAGRLMLQNGAETYRVEDTITRLAQNYGMKASQVFVTPTAIILSLFEKGRTMDYTKIVRIVDRSTDLHVVVLVNDLSRKVASESLSLDTARKELKKIEKTPEAYPAWVQTLAAILVSGCFALMFQGNWRDFMPAMIAGGAGYVVFLVIKRYISVRFFSELLAAFVIGLVAKLAITSGMGSQLDKIIIGAVMPLVPGVLITNAVRDLMAGHLVSGISLGAEAMLTAFAIGTGIAFVIVTL